MLEKLDIFALDKKLCGYLGLFGKVVFDATYPTDLSKLTIE